jgi:hypothetical protein
MSRPSTSRGMESDDDTSAIASARSASVSECVSATVRPWKSKPSRLAGAGAGSLCSLSSLAGGGIGGGSGSNMGSTVVSVKSLRKPEVIAELPVLSEEEKLRAMLGFKDEDVNKVSEGVSEGGGS